MRPRQYEEQTSPPILALQVPSLLQPPLTDPWVVSGAFKL